jgi:outer membrane protein assembly factor BamB
MKPLQALAALVIFAAAGLGADPAPAWPQFRGPGGSGVADTQRPPLEFGPDRNVKWKVPVPSGLSCPIAVADLLVLTAFDDGKLYTIAYRRANGKEAWRAQAPAAQIERYHKTEGSPAASTPATDGQRIVSYFGSCGLVSYDLAGKELWKFPLPVAVLPGDFGSGVSPIIADGAVILVRDQIPGSKIYAVDAATGALRWEKPRTSPVSYCTPVVWDTPEGKQVVTAGHGRMIAYDLKTGAEKWSVASMPSGCCASPVIADGLAIFAGWSPGGPDDKENQLPTFDAMLKLGDADKDGALSREEAAKTPMKDMFDALDANKDGKISRDEWGIIVKFMADGKNSAYAVKPGGAGDVTATHLLWRKTKGLPYIASVLVYRGQCVMVKDGGLITACDAKTGKELYFQERLGASGRYYASPVAANGYIYFTSLDGTITVVKAGADKPEVVAKNSLGERVAATPAVADNMIYVRGEKYLYAFGEMK